MKGSHHRPADQCPFVLRHSMSQVASFMQLGMLWIWRLHQSYCAWRWYWCRTWCRRTHQVDRGKCYAPTNGSPTVLVLISCNKEMLQDVAQAVRPRCKPLVLVTSHVAIRNTSGRAPFPCLNNVPTGTGQCSCIHQIDQQQLPASHLLATSQRPVNEHVVNVALHTDNQQIAINQQMCFS